MDSQQRFPLPWQQADLEAVSRLIEPICRRNSIEGQASDDIVQESLLVVEAKFKDEEFDSADYCGERFSSPRIARAAMYACKCAVNIARDHQKLAYIRRARERAAWTSQGRIDLYPPRQADEILFLELAACVRGHLSKNENLLREMLEGGIKVKEICKRLGITKEACYKRVKRLEKKSSGHPQRGDSTNRPRKGVRDD